MREISFPTEPEEETGSRAGTIVICVLAGVASFILIGFSGRAIKAAVSGGPIFAHHVIFKTVEKEYVDEELELLENEWDRAEFDETAVLPVVYTDTQIIPSGEVRIKPRSVETGMRPGTPIGKTELTLQDICDVIEMSSGDMPMDYELFRELLECLIIDDNTARSMSDTEVYSYMSLCAAIASEFHGQRVRIESMAVNKGATDKLHFYVTRKDQKDHWIFYPAQYSLCINGGADIYDAQCLNTETIEKWAGILLKATKVVEEKRKAAEEERARIEEEKAVTPLTREEAPAEFWVDMEDGRIQIIQNNALSYMYGAASVIAMNKDLYGIYEDSHIPVDNNEKLLSWLDLHDAQTAIIKGWVSSANGEYYRIVVDKGYSTQAHILQDVGAKTYLEIICSDYTDSMKADELYEMFLAKNRAEVTKDAEDPMAEDAVPQDAP